MTEESRQHRIPWGVRAWVVFGACLAALLAACADEAALSGLYPVSVAFDVAADGLAAQGVPIGATAATIAVRVYRSDVLAAYDAALLLDGTTHEPTHGALDPHPVYGVGAPKRVRFDAERVQNELGATTLYLLDPADTLELAFRTEFTSEESDTLADLTLVATAFAAGAVPDGEEFPAGAVLAVGTLTLPFATDPGSIETSVRVPLRSLATAATLAPRLPIDAVYPGRAYDFALSVTATVGTTLHLVPTGDYTAGTYTLGSALPDATFGDTAPERARGIRVVAGDPTLPASLTVATDVSVLQVAGTPAVYARPAAIPVSASIPFGGDGFAFDVTAPTLTVAATLTAGALAGTAADDAEGSGLASVRVFDGPRLLASDVTTEFADPDVAEVTLLAGAFTAPLTALNAVTGDAYRVTVVATDLRGNQARISGIVDLAAATFVQTDPEIP